jgi:AcrR family transcriptional regulator
MSGKHLSLPAQPEQDFISHRRLSPETRERAIVDGAIRFFAEYGFEATTRHLARKLGITQPLLYRYFPSKEALIERVYHEVFMQRWKPEWEGLILDRERGLEDRLVSFYSAYAVAVYDFVWVRIFVYSGLKGIDINTRYLTIVRDKVLKPICRELRHAQGLPDETAISLSEAEIELAWGLHGAFFYRAIRRYVYAMPDQISDADAIANDVRIFLDGARRIQRQLVESATEAN